MSEKQTAFIDSLVEHMERTADWERLDKRDVVILVGKILMEDVGAAQDFLDAHDIDANFLCVSCSQNLAGTNPNQLQFNLGDIYGNNLGGGTLDAD